MSGDQAWIRDLSSVIDGARLEVWDGRNLLCAGTVDQVDPAHGIVWILEDGIGERKMFPAEQYHLQCWLPDRTR